MAERIEKVRLDCPGFLVLFAPDGGSNYRDIFSLQSRFGRRKVARWALIVFLG